MSGPFLLAPMAELSHRALRELIESLHGADEYFTEMINAGPLIGGGPFETWYLDNGPCPEKLVYQLVGSDENLLVRAVQLLEQWECRGIDLNMGCSAPAITRTGAGVRWMADIEKTARLIRLIRGKTRRRLSVKLRIGLSDDFEYLVRFCRSLEQEGVDLITLHPRTAKEKFKRSPRWDYVSALRKELKIPLAGNGNISTPEEMVRRLNNCDAVMIGRLAVKQPWIFAEAARSAAQLPSQNSAQADAAAFSSVTKVNLEETGLRFLELLARYQPPEFQISRARRFFNYFCDNLKWATYTKNLLNRETTLSGMEKVWHDCFTDGT